MERLSRFAWLKSEIRSSKSEMKEGRARWTPTDRGVGGREQPGGDCAAAAMALCRIEAKMLKGAQLGREAALLEEQLFHVEIWPEWQLVNA